jgi:hypothetical protein
MGITGFPYSTGDVLAAAEMNALVTFDPSTKTADYTAVLDDSYQSLIVMNKATAIAFKIPTDASVAYPNGTVLTVVSIGAGTCTISAVTPGTTTIASAGAVSASPTLAQYKSAACLKISANNWVIVGAIA